MSKLNSFNTILDKIKIIAPASGVPSSLNNFEKEFQIFKQRSQVTYWDFHPNFLAGDELPYYAQSLDFRVKDLLDTLNDPEVKVIWCVRGGYGSAELLPFLPKKPTGDPKILIGFSDISALHCYFNEFLKWPSVHADTLSKISLDTTTNNYSEVLDIISGKLSNISYLLKPLNSCAKNVSETFSGTLVGGNLSVLSSLLGTHYIFDQRDKILFFEDVNERAYKIMEKLNHWQLAQKLLNIKAIIFGDFTKSDELDGRNYVDITLKIFANKMNTPVFRCKDIGHGNINHPIVLGTKAFIEDGFLKINNPFIGISN